MNGPVPLFVYGTLRPGGALQDMTAAAADRSRSMVRAYVRGYRLYWGPANSYPYMVRTGDQADVVRGTALMAVNGRMLRQIIAMESGAGYHAAGVVPVGGPNGPDLPESLAFVLPRSLAESWSDGALPLTADPAWGAPVYDWLTAEDALLLPEPADEVETIPRYPYAKKPNPC